ncbi:hypothetical protein NDU88_004563 [Pleurodeles waltl]|uniref:Uncharacterized protein n=1 Tax=Pleurodeles waltl TaxID=8319 RepID=A0AAV7VJ29_PLEWA|nr:hypothetical protein NDU88_004563 [Pleurodeles waltl]
MPAPHAAARPGGAPRVRKSALRSRGDTRGAVFHGEGPPAAPRNHASCPALGPPTAPPPYRLSPVKLPRRGAGHHRCRYAAGGPSRWARRAPHTILQHIQAARLLKKPERLLHLLLRHDPATHRYVGKPA